MTMADIKRAAKDAGSPYFDRASVRFFGGDTFGGPYVGAGGIYFAQSNRAGHKVKHVTLDPFRILSVADASSHADAREQAKALARSSHTKTPSQLQREIDEVLARPLSQSPYSVHTPEWERDRLVRKLEREKARLERGPRSHATKSRF